MSLMNKIMSFSRTPQGRKLTDRATRYAQDPENRRRFTQARERITARGGRAGRGGKVSR